MAKVLPVVLTSPGSAGLNTEQQFQLLGPEWLTKAENAILTYDGRVGARKGWVSMTENEPVENSTDVEVTVGNLDNVIFGYWAPDVGSIDPPSVSLDGREVQRIVFFNTGEFGLRFTDGTLSVPESIITIEVETANGTLEFDAQDHDSTSGNYLRWTATESWGMADEGSVYTVRFLGEPSDPAPINVITLHEYTR